jgi:hypothetical protein
VIRRGSPLLLLVGAVVGAAQAPGPRVVLRTPGPGRPARIVQEALASPHELVVALDSTVVLPRDSVIPRSVLVLGGDAKVGASVRGDVVVVDGDLYLHPGAAITGRAVAIGGCVYYSTLAEVRGGHECYRDVTFAVTRTARGLALDYRLLATRAATRLVSLPLAYGVRLPEYNRVDGVVLPWGPRVSLDSGRVDIDPLITYRSDLGAFDPSLVATARLGRRTWAEARVERGTVSNDRWIYSDLLNSLSTLVRGRDARNYYRADRATARLGRSWEGESAIGTFWVGALTERARSVRSGGPWSVLGHSDRVEGMLRPNPPVVRGAITSAVLGGDGSWSRMQVRTTLAVALEVPVAAPTDARFTQLTAHAGVSFPTFGSQSFWLEAHGVVTGGDTAPPQRFGYLGGSGTLPTLRLLEQGGDHLVFVEARYVVPFERLRLPIVGAPELALREMIGAAGVGRLPRLVQNIGLRATLRPLRVEYVLDPVSRDDAVSVGITLGR